mmetsp:Transcript_18695/g.72133  ORF Transcript_18695/g.72133 Transcript_18695/m.72133 type:complete len:300 (-) Transcript_18695:386-1285(-)
MDGLLVTNANVDGLDGRQCRKCHFVLRLWSALLACMDLLELVHHLQIFVALVILLLLLVTAVIAAVVTAVITAVVAAVVAAATTASTASTIGATATAVAAVGSWRRAAVHDDVHGGVTGNDGLVAVGGELLTEVRHADHEAVVVALRRDLLSALEGVLLHCLARELCDNTAAGVVTSRGAVPAAFAALITAVVTAVVAGAVARVLLPRRPFGRALLHLLSTEGCLDDALEPAQLHLQCPELLLHTRGSLHLLSKELFPPLCCTPVAFLAHRLLAELQVLFRHEAGYVHISCHTNDPAVP